MTTLNEIRQMFFVECEEQMEQLTDGLNAIEAAGAAGTPDGETINTMFRAAHSIKGGAASFALHAITKFAHAFESVLDEVRGGRLAMTPERLRAFYAGADYLADLIALGADGREPDEDSLRAQIAAVTAMSDATAQSVSAPVVAQAVPEPMVAFADQELVAEPLDDADCLAAFTPRAMDFGLTTAVPDPAPQRFAVTLRPTADLYANGHEPLHLLRELGELGAIETTAHLDADRDWADPAPTLTWSILLTTDQDEAVIREVFDFVEPFAGLSIEPIPTAAPAAEADPDPVDVDPLSLFTPTPIAVLPPADTDGPAAPADAGPSNVVAFEPPAGPAATEAKGKAGPKATVRIELDLVDDLINTVGELVITQSVMSQSLAEGGIATGSRLNSTLEEFRALTRQIQEGIMAIRAQSVKPLFQRMARIVRETAQIAGKEVRFVTEGEDTEIDRTVTERLVDPLTHILRNAIDHGLEHADRRLAAGKSTAGTVTLSAAHRSGRVLIEVRDDGGGIDRDKVRAIAIRKGLISENAVLSPAEIDRLLFLPGFSTASAVTNLSGRGVGMDVVNNEIKRWAAACPSRPSSAMARSCPSAFR